MLEEKYIGHDFILGPLIWVNPVETAETQTLRVNPSAEAVFKCYVYGEPNIHAEWFVDGEPLGESPSLMGRNVSILGIRFLAFLTFIFLNVF